MPRRLFTAARRPKPVTAMYLGYNGGSALTTYESTNTIDIPWAHEFGDSSQWTWFEFGTEFSTWNTWVGAKAGRRFTYSVPLLTFNDDSGLTIPQKYVKLVAGDYDSHFTTLGQSFQAQPNLRNAICRIGWEFNGNSRAWAVPPSDQTTLDNYKAGYNRVAGLLRAQCPTLEFEWCPNCQLDYTQRTFADMYPGETYVDYIGIGLYDYCWGITSPTQTQREVWLRDSVNGLADQVAMARAHGKKLAHTEWGVWPTGDGLNGGGDRPAFIDFMADWYAQNSYSFHAINNWQTPEDHRLETYPLSKARYLARFR